jgi:cyclomaltodextrinase
LNNNIENLIHKKFKHFKNRQLYELVGIARHSETLEEMVVYKALYETKFGYGTLWVRPKSMFFEIVNHNGKAEPRFQLIEEEI